MSFEPTPPHLMSENSLLTALVPLWDAGEETRVLAKDGEFTFGSNRSNKVRLLLNGVAPQHCRIVCANGDVTVQPIDSSPVHLNDVPVASEAALAAGDKLAIGPASFRVEHRRPKPTMRAAFSASPQPSASRPAGPMSPASAPPNRPGGRRASDAPAPPVPVVPSFARPAAKPNLAERQQRLLKEREVQLQNWQKQIDQRTEELDQRASQASEREAQLQQRAAAFEQRCAEVEAEQQQRSEAATREHEQRAAELEWDLATRSEQLTEREQAVEARHAALQQLESQLEEAATAGAESEAAVSAERDAAMQEVEELRTQLQQQETDLQVALAELEAQKQDHELHVSNVRSEFSEREATIAADLAASEEKAHALTQATIELDERIEQLDAAKDAFEAEKQDRLVETAAAEQKTSTRNEELAAWEAELEARHVEMADRVQNLKRLKAEAATAVSQEAEQPSHFVAESHEQAEQLEEARCELERVTAERDDIAAALEELRTAFERMRDDLLTAEESASQSAGEGDGTDQQQAAAAIAERDEALAAANEVLMAQVATVQELEERILQQASEFEAERQQLAEQLHAVEQSAEQNGSANTDESDLLQQIEQLKGELSSSNEGGGPSDELQTQQIEQYENSIRDLSAQLEEARNLIEQQSESDDGVEQEYIALIAELKQRLQEQDEQLKALTDEAAAHDQQAVAAEDSEEVKRLHRELDERTHVLDDREAELRERQRKLDQLEEEFATHRRELLEARQELEMARAELHVVSEPPAIEMPAHEEEPPADMSYESAHNLPSTFESDGEPHDDHNPPQVRSELAELFGIGSVSAAEPEQSDAREELAAVDDYSQETAAAVSMSFSEADNVLLEASTDDDLEAAATAGEDESEDDFVAQYMEQLLSRSRTGAGETLPAELSKKSEKPSTTKSNSANKDEKPPAAPRQTKSFIDAYMSGEYKESMAQPEPVAELPPEPAPKKPTEPRPKVDLHALRNEMASFRQLSTRSAESALAHHAKRQEKGGITTRVTICVALCLVCLFVLAAASSGLIPFGFVAWLSILAACTSGGELAYKIWQNKEKLKESAAILSHGSAVAPAASSTEDLIVEPPVDAGDAAAKLPSDTEDSQATTAPDAEMNVTETNVTDNNAADQTPANASATQERVETETDHTDAVENPITADLAATPESAGEVEVDTNSNAIDEPALVSDVEQPESSELDSEHPVAAEASSDQDVQKLTPKSWLDMMPASHVSTDAADESSHVDSATSDGHHSPESEFVEFDGEKYFEI